MIDVLLDSGWVGPLLWAALYVSDYFLTIACARMYQAQDKLVFEGRYEITPLFQADVNALRRWSPRFVIALLASTGYPRGNAHRIVDARGDSLKAQRWTEVNVTRSRSC